MAEKPTSSLGAVLRTSLPAAVDLSSQTVTWLLEFILIGQLLSAPAIAGVGLALQLIILTFTIVLTFVVGASIIINRHLGAGENWEANHVLAQALVIGTVLAFVISAMWYLGGTQLFAIIKEEEPLAREYGVEYLKTLSYFGPLIIVNFVGLRIVSMCGDTLIAMKVSLITSMLHLGLDMFLIPGAFGFPRLEASGAAWSAGIAHSCAFFLTLYYLRSRKACLFLSFREYGNPNFETFRKLFKLGIPTTVEQLVWAIGQLVLSVYAGLLGVIILSAHQIFVRIQSVLTMAFQGFGLAAMTLVGKQIGAGEDEEALATGKMTGRVAALSSALVSVLLLVFSDVWMPIFTSDAEVIEVGNKVILVLAIIQIPKALNIVFMGNLRGGADLSWLMWLTVASVGFFEIVGAWALSFVFNFALVGLWLVQGVDEGIRFVANYWRFRQMKWKTKSII